MPIIARDDGAFVPDVARLELERLARRDIRRIFEAALADRWDSVASLWAEARAQGEWYSVAVWCGLPNTLKERIRENQ